MGGVWHSEGFRGLSGHTALPGLTGQSDTSGIRTYRRTVIARLLNPPRRAESLMDIEQYIQPIIDYVRLHQAWAAPIVFALCFAESLAFISLLIPAWAALVGIGALISASD